ncbi:MAG: hypothetical protein HY664_05520 [Chloroflexi bacterium]|nr:hypothetical protein [Chloroflexota bacterium]
MTQGAIRVGLPASAKGSVPLLVGGFVVAFMVMILIPVWFLLGAVGAGAGHVHGGAKISQEWFVSKINAQQQKYGLPDGSVRIPPGNKVTVTMPDGLVVPASTSKVYIMMRQFSFTPSTVRLQFGGLYDLLFFSPDVFHGASLIQDGSLNAVVMPNMTSKLTVRVTKLGEIQILCNEYCGLGHHLMMGKIIVE